MSRKAQHKKQQDGEQEKPSFHKITSSRIVVQVLTPYYINAEEGGFLTRFPTLFFLCNRRWLAAADAVPAAAVYQMNFRVNGKGFAGANAPH